MRFSDWNQFKFIEVDSSTNKEFINWFDVFPNGSNRLHCNDRFKPRKPLAYTYKTLRNALSIQFQSENEYADIAASVDLTLIDRHGSTVNIDVTFTNITPSVWSAGNGYEDYIYSAEISLTESYSDFMQPVYFKMEADSEVWITNPFEIHDRLEDHVMIKYGNSENDFGMIFYDEDTSYYQTLFIHAEMAKNPGGDKSIYVGDRGTIQTLRSTPIKGYTVNIPVMPEWLMEKLNFILNCNEITFNKVSCTSDEGLEFEKMNEYFNGYTGSINIAMDNWDYREEQTILTNYVLVDSGDEVVIDDDDNALTN